MKKSRILLLLSLTIGAFLLIPGPHALAQLEGERILDFRSTITVQKDASLLVTEVIRVNCTGETIQHGIYRDFPVSYKIKGGFRQIRGFTVVSVMRDGQPENYVIEDNGASKRVKMGDADKLVSHGVHIYVLTYLTDRQLGFFEDFTELYWNVTGNEWAFPIDSASANVFLPVPGNVRVIGVDGYTGPAGAKDKNFTSRVMQNDMVHFESTRPLSQGEGLTIVVQWPRGYVNEPTEEDLRREFISSNKGPIVGIAGVALVFLYYLVVWFLVGKDPARGTIIPYYTPPDRLSPAAMRYITEMGYDNEVFAAALINMAVKGHLTITDDKGEYTLTKTGPGEELAAEEKKISEKLFKKGSTSIVLETANHSTIAGAIDAFKSSLSLSYEKNYFVKNIRYFVPGLVLSSIAIIASLAIGFTTTPENFLLVWLFFWTIGVFFLLSRVVMGWKAAIHTRRWRALSIGGALFLTLFSIPFVGAELVVLGLYLSTGSWMLFVAVLGMATVNYAFYHLLKAPTRAGRKALDKIEGFRLFLAVTETDRLNALSTPEKTIETFERFLPYALALGVANRWAEYFAETIAAAGAARGSDGYSPGWYSGSSWSSIGTTGFVSSLGSSLGGAVASSSVSPSSSGGGGGGSSGGGGGGGGGGGW